MLLNVFFPVCLVIELLVPLCRRQVFTKETKRTLAYGSRRVAVHDFVKLDGELLDAFKVSFAVLLPTGGIRYPLVALEAKLCKPVLLLKESCVASEDVAPSIGYVNPIVEQLA
jgi:hypothetical protein